MQIWEQISLLLGGNVVVGAGVVHLSKVFLKNLFAKGLENHKALLSRESNESIERLKSDLQKESNESIERLKSDLQRESKHQDSLIELKGIMDNYKGPLLHSSYELQSRIYNLVSNGVLELYFVKKFGDGSERNYLLNNTVFVIAQYFAWTEIIRREIQFIELDNPEETKGISEIQDRIYSLWNANRGIFDDPLMIWAGEQRGIGEIMIRTKDNKLVCIGYAKFLKILDSRDEDLLNQLKKKVEKYISNNGYERNRLIPVQNSLIDLLTVLDPSYIRFPMEQRSKIT